jgi:hypothetical protein
MTADNDDVRGETARPVIDESLIDRLMDQVDAEGLELLGPDGVLTELTSRVLLVATESKDPMGWHPPPATHRRQASMLRAAVKTGRITWPTSKMS